MAFPSERSFFFKSGVVPRLLKKGTVGTGDGQDLRPCLLARVCCYYADGCYANWFFAPSRF